MQILFNTSKYKILTVSEFEALIIVGIALIILLLPFVIMRFFKKRKKIEKIDLGDFEEEIEEDQ